MPGVEVESVVLATIVFPTDHELTKNQDYGDHYIRHQLTVLFGSASLTVREGEDEITDG
jgi:hypothetical protein